MKSSRTMYTQHRSQPSCFGCFRIFAKFTRLMYMLRIQLSAELYACSNAHHRIVCACATLFPVIYVDSTMRVLCVFLFFLCICGPNIKASKSHKPKCFKTRIFCPQEMTVYSSQTTIHGARINSIRHATNGVDIYVYIKMDTCVTLSQFFPHRKRAYFRCHALLLPESRAYAKLAGACTDQTMSPPRALTRPAIQKKSNT